MSKGRMALKDMENKMGLRGNGNKEINIYHIIAGGKQRKGDAARLSLRKTRLKQIEIKGR